MTDYEIIETCTLSLRNTLSHFMEIECVSGPDGEGYRAAIVERDSRQRVDVGPVQWGAGRRGYRRARQWGYERVMQLEHRDRARRRREGEVQRPLDNYR